MSYAVRLDIVQSHRYQLSKSPPEKKAKKQRREGEEGVWVESQSKLEEVWVKKSLKSTLMNKQNRT